MGPSREFSLELGAVHPAAREIGLSMDLDKDAAFVTERIMAIVFPERADDPAFRELMSHNAYDNLDAMWRIIAGLDDLEVTPPQGAITFNDRAAQIGVPLGQFERIYRVGVGLVWTLWFQAAVDWSRTRDVALEDLLAGPSMIIHAYIDGQISTLLERFETTHAEHQRTRDQLRLSILRQVLDGSPALGRAEVEAALGISVEAEHLAVTVRTESVEADSALARALQEASGSTGVLPYPAADWQWLVWLSHPDGFGDAGVAAVRSVLAGTGLRCTLGDPAWGTSGLTSSGREALDAARLQDRLGAFGDTVTAYDDVRLEALLLSDPQQARRFVRAELRDLDAEDARSASLRDTAQTWLTCGSNVSTSQALGVHEHTVRNRIATIQELIGRPLTSRRTELLVALRLRRMLDLTP